VTLRAFCTRLFCASLVVAPLGCGGENTASGGASSPSGVTTQDFEGRTYDGKTVRLSDHLGKDVVLVNFWGTFCDPCLAEFPHIQRIYEANAKKGFAVIAVAMDGPETEAQIAPFVKRNGLTFPVLVDGDSVIVGKYNPKKSAPLTILFDRTGKVVKVHEGYNPGDEDTLEREVTELVSAK
jgi:peroxiredoxin